VTVELNRRYQWDTITNEKNKYLYYVKTLILISYSLESIKEEIMIERQSEKIEQMLQNINNPLNILGR